MSHYLVQSRESRVESRKSRPPNSQTRKDQLSLSITPAARKSSRIAARRAENSASAARARGRQTTLHPAAILFSSSSRRQASRRRRLRRFLLTAPPNFLPTEKPIRTPSPSRASTRSAAQEFCTRRPEEKSLSNSPLVRRDSMAGQDDLNRKGFCVREQDRQALFCLRSALIITRETCGWQKSPQAGASCLRPLRRRRLMTFLPPGVLMRSRNPCTLCLWRLLG